MFKYSAVFSLMFFLPLYSFENIFDKGVDFKDGVIHYSVSGSISGTKTMYIKNHGKRRVVYTNIKNSFMSRGKSKDKIKYVTPKWIYEIDLEKKMTTKLPNIKYLLLKKYKLLSEENKKVISQKLKNRSIYNVSGFVSDGENDILGYSCKLESIDGIMTHTAKKSDLVLKTQTSILGFNQTVVATNLEKKDLNTDIFTLPKNLRIIDTHQKLIDLEKKVNSIIKSLLFTENKKVSKSNQKDDIHSLIQQSASKLSNL